MCHPLWMLDIVEMTPEEFKKYSKLSFNNFIRESAEAAQKKITELEKELGGPPTQIRKDELWMTVKYNSQNIGFVWIQVFSGKKEAFGWDIFLEQDFRSKGLGRELMLKCGALLKEKGITKVKICVYDHNQIARTLYDSLKFNPIKFDKGRNQHFLEIDL